MSGATQNNHNTNIPLHNQSKQEDLQETRNSTMYTRSFRKHQFWKTHRNTCTCTCGLVVGVSDKYSEGAGFKSLLDSAPNDLALMYMYMYVLVPSLGIWTDVYMNVSPGASRHSGMSWQGDISRKKIESSREYTDIQVLRRADGVSKSAATFQLRETGGRRTGEAGTTGSRPNTYMYGTTNDRRIGVVVRTLYTLPYGRAHARSHKYLISRDKISRN